MIQHITGILRNQLFFSSLQDIILPENPARFIDAFVESLSLQTLGFSVQTIKRKGRLSFDTKIFLKIYLYGYLNGLEPKKARKGVLAILNCNGFYAPSYSTTKAYPTLESKGHRLKNLFKLFVSFS
jgi:transposase